jgi:hypothetical protein
MNYSGKNLNKLTYFLSVSDDMTIWKWNIDGESVSIIFGVKSSIGVKSNGN